MDTEFWHARWQKNEIGFHQSKTNPFLVAHFKELSLEEGSRVFIPLCGKTRDIGWLLSQGYQIAGVELSEIAVRQLFEDLGLEPTISKAGNLQCFSAKNVDIFVGDFFDLSAELVGPVGAVYDRAALVALPKDMRRLYAAHLTKVTGKSPQLLVCYAYDQSLMDGPPFSVSNDEVTQLYDESYDLTLVATIDLPEKLKGKCAAQENTWMLR